MIVPLNTSDFTRLTANAGAHVDVLADFNGALRAPAGNGTRMGRDFLNLKRSWIAHLRPPSKPSRSSRGTLCTPVYTRLDLLPPGKAGWRALATSFLPLRQSRDSPNVSECQFDKSSCRRSSLA